MRRSRLLAGTQVAADDSKVIRALLMSAVAIDDEPEPAEYVVGVSNESGRVYRLVTLFGLAEYARFAREMAAVGFEAEPTIGLRGRASLDALFARRPRGP